MAGGWPHRRMSTERAYESYLEHRDPEVNQVMESEDQENSSSLAIVIVSVIIVLVFILLIFII